MSSTVSIAAALLALGLALAGVYLSQRFWFGLLWSLAGRVTHSRMRIAVRLLCIAGVVVVFAGAVLWVLRLRNLLPWPFFAVLGLWLLAGFFGWLGIRVIRGIESAWERLSARRARRRGETHLPSPARRYFFQRAAYFAGAAPFVGAAYGFLAERRWFRVERVEAPVPGLPAALDGLRILQLSDIHIGSYMTREHLRRAIELTGGLDPHLVALTGDFVTWQRDPLEACIEELAVLRAPLGVWGCNGNHETYAGKEERAAELFRQAGFRLLRQANGALEWRGAPLNLIGVDHQATRPPVGSPPPMLLGVESLVQPGAFNILLSHNPNAFPRAAELGIGLTLAGHTHGGQIQLELLHPWLNPARFITPFVAGLYSLPAGAAASSTRRDPEPAARHSTLVTSSLYVNRGLGTVGAPIRVGAPPEITLLILRRA